MLAKGFTKLVQQFDDLEASREGAGFRETSTVTVRKHLEDIGLDGDIAQYNEISGLSGGASSSGLESLEIFPDTFPHLRTKDQACHCGLFVEQSSGTVINYFCTLNVTFIFGADLRS